MDCHQASKIDLKQQQHLVKIHFRCWITRVEFDFGCSNQWMFFSHCYASDVELNMILEAVPKIQHDVSVQNVHRNDLKMQGIADGWRSATMATAWWPSKTAAHQGRFRGFKPWTWDPKWQNRRLVRCFGSIWIASLDMSCWSYESEILGQGNLSCAISSDHFFGGNGSTSQAQSDWSRVVFHVMFHSYR